MKLLKICATIFIVIAVLVNSVGPFLLSLAVWDNYIQWIDGYEMAIGGSLAISHMVKIHQRLNHLHDKHDALHRAVKEKESAK